jgi:hypothetical protein
MAEHEPVLSVLDHSIAARHALLGEPDGTVSYEQGGAYDHVRFGASTEVVERNSVLLIPGVHWLTVRLWWARAHAFV